MEKAETEKPITSSEDGSQLNRNRSFKSKQLVRSQAIRETASPPRAASPAPPPARALDAADTGGKVHREAGEDNANDMSSVMENFKKFKEDEKGTEVDSQQGGGRESGQKQRARRGLGDELLSDNPRVACICGPQCSGNQRHNMCPTKQDSGISCSDDCADCSDTEHSGGSNSESLRKSESVNLQTEQSFCRCSERKEKPKNISISKTESEERQELSEAELVAFIKATLNKNSRDRMTLLKIEKELHSLVNDTGRCIVRFPVMTSYGRMLVHRVARLFELAHHLDSTNKNCVMVSKNGTSGGRIPCTSFKQWCTANLPSSPHHVPNPDFTQAKSILKRDAHSLDEGGCAGVAQAQRSKSLEQREREYERVRRRIFGKDNFTADESQWPWLPSNGTVKVLAPESGRNRLLKVQSLEGPQGSGWRNRGAVSKSHSFGGYEPAPRVLSRQGDRASSNWHLSPSSSGYKTLSLRSTDSVTPSPTGGVSPEPPAGGALVWAVTDLASVPPGALIIHPQTGRPLTNPDGSVYRYDPANPRVVYADQDKLELDRNTEKYRGWLEQQHSFIDNASGNNGLVTTYPTIVGRGGAQESEGQRPEECRGKGCSCECRRSDTASALASQPEQTSNHPERDPTPQTPAKTVPQTAETASCDAAANQMPEYDAAANQVLGYDAAANQGPAYEETANERAAQHEATSQKLAYEVTNQHAAHKPPTNRRTLPHEAINHRPQSLEPASQAAACEPQTNQRTRSYESANQAAGYEPQTNQRTQSYTPTNQQAGYEAQTNQRTQSFEPANRLAEIRQTHELQTYLRHMHYRNEQEIMSAQLVNPGYVQDPSMMVQPMVGDHALNVHDSHMTQMSLSGMVYQTQLPSGYAYASQCRVEAPLPAPVYQPVAPPGGDEQKLQPHFAHAQEPTFRIDASYPYQPVEACAGGAGFAPQLGYSMGFGQLEAPRVMPTCPMVQPQPYTVPYQPIGWQTLQPILTTTIPSNCATPVQRPTSPTSLYLPPSELTLNCPYSYYPQCPYPVLPQVMPYQLCQTMYPLVEAQQSVHGGTAPVTPVDDQRTVDNRRLSKQASLHESRPQDNRCAEDRRKYARSHSVRDNLNPNTGKLEVKVHQLKDQMSALSTQERDGREGLKGEKGRRNNGSGILGSYPAGSSGCNSSRSVGRPANDESQLSSAARAIVHSIRSMQAKNTVQQDYRLGPEYHGNQPRYDQRRPDHQQMPDHQPRPGHQQRLDHHQRPRHHRGHEVEASRVGSELFVQVQQDYRLGPEYHGNQTRYDIHRPDHQPRPDHQQRPDHHQRPRHHRGHEVEASREGSEQSVQGIQFMQPERPDRTQCIDPRGRPINPIAQFPYGQPYMLRQMSPINWCGRSPGPLPPALNMPRRPPPDNRSQKRQ